MKKKQQGSSTCKLTITCDSFYSSPTQTLMSAMGTLGGSNFIFPRLYRHMFVVAVDSFEDSTIIRIFTTIGDWHFAKGYPEKVALLSRVCTKSQPTNTTHNPYAAATTTTANTTETRTHSRGNLFQRFLSPFFFFFWLNSRRWRIIKLKWRIL